jgi:RNA polymerase sigma factor (sigma-70 family)
MKIGCGISRRELNTLYTLLYPKIKYHVQHLAGKIDSHELEEITQHVMFKSFDKLHQWNKDKGALTTWIYTIARNDYFQYIKDSKKKPVHFSLLGLDAAYGLNQSISDDVVIRAKSDRLVETQSPESLVLDREESEEAWRTINKIKDKLSNGIHKSIFEDYIVEKKRKLKDIAAEYNLNVNNVKSKLFQVRRKLRVEYGSNIFEIFVR